MASSCGTHPSAARASDESAGEPKTATLPASGMTRPTMARISVLLPAPFGPSRPRHSPPRSSSEMPSTAVTGPKRLTSESTSSGIDSVGLVEDWARPGTEWRLMWLSCPSAESLAREQSQRSKKKWREKQKLIMKSTLHNRVLHVKNFLTLTIRCLTQKELFLLHSTFLGWIRF